VRRAGSWDVPPLADRGAAQVAADEIREVMWDHVGIVRHRDGLERALEVLAAVEQRLPAGATEEINMCQTATLIARAALARPESRGGHFRSDYPRPARGWAKRHVEL
jgi:L-aspartate oxidase